MKFSIYPFKRKNKYRLYIRFEDESGKRRHLSTGVTYPLDANQQQRRAAQKKAENKAQSILLEHFHSQKITQAKQQQASILSEYLDEYYYPHIRTNRAESTLISYRNALNHFMRIIGDHTLDTYDRKMINQYKLTRCDTEGIKKTTIDIELRSIKAAFSWAYKNEYLRKKTYEGQDFLFKAKIKKREFKHYEIEKILKFTEGQIIGVIIRLAYYTGMRIGEMYQIKWAMIYLKKRHIFIPKEISKSKKDRFLPLGPKAFNMVKVLENILQQKMKKIPEHYENLEKEECYLLQKERGHGQYAKRSIQQKFRRCMNEAGLPKELTFHSLRHSFATHALEHEGVDLYGVSKVLGHSTPKVTADFYAHTTALNHRHVVEVF